MKRKNQILMLVMAFFVFHALAQDGASFLAEATLKKQLDASYYLVNNDSIRFKFEEEYNDQDNNLEYVVYDDQNSIVLDQNSAPLFVKYGYNRYGLFVGALANGFYKLEVTNEKEEKMYLRFKK